MFEFTVPDGDWDLVGERRHFKPLVFTEKKKKRALWTIKEFLGEGVEFTLVYIPKEGKLLPGIPHFSDDGWGIY